VALNFPNSPGIGSVYTDSVSGFSYEWDGTVWKSYSLASSSQIKILDDISGSFNGIGKTFAITSNSVAISPPSPQSLIINLGGVVQDPTDDYSVSGSNIIFSDAPTSGLTFSGVSLGFAVPITTILDGTTTQGSLNVVGLLSAANLIVSGVSTFTNGPVLIGSGTSTGTESQSLQVTGGAYVSGNLGIGTTNSTYKLQVKGQTLLGGNSADAYLAIYDDNGGSNISFEAYNLANTVKKDITLNSYGGNVGIGTTNPTQALHVVGDTLITGIATASGGFNIGIQSAGTNVTTGVITAINFVGTGNTFQYNAGTKTVSVSISGGGGGFSIRNYILSI